MDNAVSNAVNNKVDMQCISQMVISDNRR